jgi:hypothetical protein
VKDWRSRRVATLFGEVVLRLPLFICAVCKRIEADIGWPRHTPVDAGAAAVAGASVRHDDVSCGCRRIAASAAGYRRSEPRDTAWSHAADREKLYSVEIAAPTAAAGAVTVSLDSTFIRGCEEGE